LEFGCDAIQVGKKTPFINGNQIQLIAETLHLAGGNNELGQR
jgi:hypothetical protein